MWFTWNSRKKMKMIKESNLDRIEIVLCDTQDGANIGSACRAMKTMGLSHLTLVTDNEYDENRVHTLALHAFDLYENRKQFTDLHEALKDSVLTVAATRRHGKDRKFSCVDPHELATRVINSTGKGKISIVFGCEANGLSDEQVNECSMVVTIPTSEKFPSLNLAQAVQIICYELFQNLKEYPNESHAVPKERVDQATEKCIKALDRIGYFKVDEERENTKVFLSDTFARASYTQSEIVRMEKVFEKASLISTHAVKQE